MKKLLLILALFLLPSTCWAECNGVFQPNTICGNLTGSPAPAKQSPLGAIGGAVQTIVTNHTLGPSECGTQFNFGGGFLTFTLNATSGYQTICSIIIVNTDSSTAKWVSVSGGISFYVWPGQAYVISKAGTAWAYNKQRWKIPTGNLTFYTNSSTGSDAPGVDDGLSPSTPYATVNGALYLLCSEFDASSTPTAPGSVAVTKFIISMGANDVTQIHWSPHGDCAPGITGGISIEINGNNHGLVATTGDTVQCYYDCILAFTNITLASNATFNTLDAFWGGKVLLESGVIFFTPGVADINTIGAGSLIECDVGPSISGSRSFHVVDNGGYIDCESVTITISNSMSGITDFVLGANGAIVDYAGVTWSLGGNTVTATNSYNIQTNAVSHGSAGIPGGTGTTSFGGQAL